VSLFVIPVPFSVTRFASPAAESAVAGSIVSLWNGLGGSWVAAGPTIQTARGSLLLTGPDMGLVLAHLLAGLGLCQAIASRDGWWTSLLRMARWGGWCVPAQIVSLATGFGCLALAGADAARALLDVAPGCVVMAVGLERLGRESRA
jgi:hypothetical protein